ncbi:MAG: asparagine synthase (glutamine-hydrolyzing) [Terriglobales bacterium]
MCGLSGVLTFSDDPGADAEALSALHNRLAHRGPDGQGFLRLDHHLQPAFSGNLPAAHPEAVRLLLGFHWLKIQDLDPRSLQPMASPDGKAWLIFNGEIYNFRELRAQLEELGHAFRTHSDSEVVLQSYRQWGTQCFSRFLGMWALLLVDLEAQVLVVSRDRLGIKPLFYRSAGARWMFASESQALAAACKGGPEADAARITGFLNGLPPASADRTFFRDIRPVPAGSYAVCSLRTPSSEIDFRKYWELPEPVADSGLAYREAQQRFETLLHDSIRSHLQTEVALGTLLSGGLDSSALVAVASLLLRGAGRPLPETYSVIFDDPEMSEWPFIQLVLAMTGSTGKNMVLNGDRVRGHVDSVIGALGRPLLGQDMIAQYCAYQLAKQHGSKVVLDGQGADEILGGLPIYEAQMFLPMIQRMQWFTLAKELRLRTKRYRNGWGRNINTYVVKPWLRARDTRDKYTHTLGLMAADDGQPKNSGPEHSWPSTSSALGRLLFNQVKHCNLPTVLEQQDHNSMRHGVESRVPYLDHRLVEFAFQLPDDFKIYQGERKRILMDTVRPLLPEAVTRRTDKRMFVSKAGWIDIRELFGNQLRELVACRAMRAVSVWDGEKVEGFVDQYLRGVHHDSSAVWRIFTTLRWTELHGVR